MSRGHFITLEGGEGAGKSTQIKRLASALEGSGIKVVATREPGGAPGAEEIRNLLVNGNTDRWAPMAEVLLHTAARAEHLDKTVMPALKNGAWVISDRFSDSTMAYQGYGHGVDKGVIENIYRDVFGDFKPDLTLIIDISPGVGLSRAGTRNQGEDRYERMGDDFHQRLRDGFLEIAKADSKRCVIINGELDEDGVFAAIKDAVAEKLGVKI
ncbi:MAG: dTMP kinase [Rhodospirillaceae bacterium]|nr:dTMP kinase [Rhodospirillaceae bacterium]